MMTLLDALILGIVEGLTEFIPVSSTGHLILTQRLLGLPEGHLSNAFAICIQSGAILAVVTLYPHRILTMLRGVFGRSREGRTMAINLVCALLPAVVVGLLFNDMIEASLFGLWPIVAAWMAGGVLILAVAGHPRLVPPKNAKGLSLEKLNWKKSVAIGLAQCLAMWPGVSRSLTTLLGGVTVGLSLSAAVEFSFLLGLVTLLAATVFKGIQYGQEIVTAYPPQVLLVGLVSAWATAMVAMRTMVLYLQRHSLRVFGVWRLMVAFVTILWII